MDTILLKFKYPRPTTHFFSERIEKKELHLPHISGSRYVWTNNSWRKKELLKGFYVPKFWIEEDFINKDITYFCIEVSLPKIIFQENLTALEAKHLEPIVQSIVEFCKKIEVYIFREQILNCCPTVVAIGKNINLTSLCSCQTALRVLAPFDYKPHAARRVISFNDYRDGGHELYFNIERTETTKFYDKKRAVINEPVTSKEKELAKQMSAKDCVIEILRVERTFKTARKIKEKFKPLLEGKPVTFQNIFNPILWEALLTEEMNLLLNHPFNNFIFLATEETPFIDAFLEKHCIHIQTRHLIRGFIHEIQTSGLASTRKEYLTHFKSRQTWYNYKSRLTKLNQQIDISSLKNLESYKVHSYILKEFGIDTTTQPTLFNTKLSKNIDT